MRALGRFRLSHFVSSLPLLHSGEYLVNGRLSGEIKGLGSVQVTRDKSATAQKYCALKDCGSCERNGTPDCYQLAGD